MQKHRFAGTVLGPVFLAVCTLLMQAPAGAETDSHTEAHSEAEEHHGESGSGHGHGYHTHTLGGFIGRAQEGRENAPAIGIEYEYRFNERFGIGAVGEYTGDKADFWVLAIPFGFHFGHLKTYIAPGIEKSDEHTEELIRVGAEYAFPISDDGWEIAPQINVDFVDGEEIWVFGVLIAKGF